MAVSDQDADKTRVHIPEEVSWMFIVIPFVVGIILVLAVLVYRCRATRNERRLQRHAAREREQELFELKGKSLVKPVRLRLYDPLGHFLRLLALDFPRGCVLKLACLGSCEGEILHR